ncbi:MAG: DUF4398 domain-containing protein [Nannocystaceae bacterium]|nr:DUF4398 domain-containing protein [bacterium]
MLFLAASAALLGGCGPFGYLGKVSRDASRAVADAEQAGAEQYAPYEYWGAVTYLEQAKILMAYSEYERSFDYGERALQLAEEAKRKADKREGGAMKETLEDDEPDTSGASGDADGTASAGDGKAEASGSISIGGGK